MGKGEELFYKKAFSAFLPVIGIKVQSFPEIAAAFMESPGAVPGKPEIPVAGNDVPQLIFPGSLIPGLAEGSSLYKDEVDPGKA